MRTIVESLDYLDMEDQISSTVTVDEYVAKMGKDSDIVTIAFTVNSSLAAEDLVTWLERGYDFVLDASVSEGEIQTGKWLVFVEMDRRAKVPERICNILSDLETLTGIKIHEWTVEVEGDPVEADKEVLSQVMILNPGEYREKKEPDSTELKEFKELAGIDTPVVYTNDEYIRSLKSMAGL